VSQSTLPKGLAWILITAAITVAPACQATASGGPQGTLGDRIARRFAYRPAYPGPNPIPGTRPLYLSGYAGARYGPDRVVAPGGALSPTAAYEQAQPLPYWTPTARGWRRLFGLEPGLLRP
jgi:hypothetical protein